MERTVILFSLICLKVVLLLPANACETADHMLLYKSSLLLICYNYHHYSQ